MFLYNFLLGQVDFIGSQSQETKVVIRLITWWALQQPWSSDFTRPKSHQKHQAILQKIDFAKVEKTVNSLQLMIRLGESVRMDPLSPLVSPQVPENVQTLGTEKCRN